MSTHILRTVEESIRAELSWAERWLGPDEGLVCCWERGREMSREDTSLAVRAQAGELVGLPWKGGTDKIGVASEDSGTRARFGSLKYLAMWQGLRGDSLSIDLDSETLVVCQRTGHTVVFRRSLPPEE